MKGHMAVLYMEIRKFLLILVLFASSNALRAQSIQDYFFKSWDLTYITPAALALDSGLVGNLNYNQDLVGSVQANVGGQLQLHTSFGSGHGVGITMQSSRSGILTGNSVGAGYAYRIRLSENQMLSAGGRFNYFKYSLNRASVKYANVDDPILYGDMFQQSSLLISTGFLYEWGQFKLAVNAPETLPIEGTRYARKNLSAYMGYSFLMNDWQIRPNFYFERLESLGNWYESNLYASYRNQFAVEVGYSSENALRAKASVAYGSFTVGYGYNAGKTAKEGSENQVGHRLFIGYNFGDVFAKSRERKAQEKQEKLHMETILRDQTLLIEDYRNVLDKVEESHVNGLQPQADSLSVIDQKVEGSMPEESQTIAESLSPKAASSGYYVAIGSFDSMRRVNIFIEEQIKSGLYPKVLYNSKVKKYRIYLNSFGKFSEALNLRNQMRKRGFKDSWIFEVKWFF
jgi:type IX secretion system PorP/SprF family membrane protein